ncbi:MAG: RagB/SusD family nutrient uptake outer membrane protein [Dysgonamonadaceae bacterium]|jgi:hypothetical protein|nr:RagB/SusD family nutrient uptake outer membrane protein [Dysgonamonadaceae bacterium]
MKKIINFIIVILAVSVFSSCEDFLDTQSFTQKNSETFPKTETDADQLLTGVYAVMSQLMNQEPSASYFLVSELASDDRFGGGGGFGNDGGMQAINHLLTKSVNTFRGFWERNYRGISRATATINALNVLDEGDLKNQKMGEAQVLRAYFYFELVQLLGNVPLIKGTPETVEDAMESPKQATQEEIFQQIGTDLWNAYSIMPSTKYTGVRSGVITKWAAAGMLARVWLFYTGFYEKTSLPINDGGEVTRAQVIAALKDCIDNSGHDLVSDFRSLWAYTNSVSKPDYPYAADAPTWIRDGSNPEQVFVVKCIGLNDWSNTGQNNFTNQLSLYFAIRNDAAKNRYENIFPMGQGWGIGPVSSRLWSQWQTDEPTDPRRKASIYNVEEESRGYTYGADGQMEETGLWQKKIVAIRAYGGNANIPAGTFLNSFWSSDKYESYTGDHFQVGHACDIPLMRFADILLMHSEVSGTADGMNRVRARVGLPGVGYSLAAIQRERRYELAFEGTRWGDIRRWHIAEQALDDMYNSPIFNNGDLTAMKVQGNAGNISARYRATKGGFFMIPQYEIDLANGGLIQNEGWGPESILTEYK